jgi:hypothetical protein
MQYCMIKEILFFKYEKVQIHDIPKFARDKVKVSYFSVLDKRNALLFSRNCFIIFFFSNIFAKIISSSTIALKSFTVLKSSRGKLYCKEQFSSLKFAYL